MALRMGQDGGAVRLLRLIGGFAAAAVASTGCSDPSRPIAEARAIHLGQPLIQIGNDPNSPLHNVTTVFEDGRGRLLVFQLNTPTVAIFDQEGRAVGELGAPGGGPGMFSLPVAAGPIGDSIWISDARLRKFAVYDKDLVHLRDEVLATGPLVPSAIGPGNAVIATRSTQDYAEWIHVGRDHSTSILTLERRSLMITVQVGDRAVSVLNPFANSSMVVFNPASGDFIILDTGDRRLSVVQLSLTGDTVQRIILPVPAQPVSPGWYDAEIERLAAFAPAGTGRELTEALKAAIPRPDSTYALSRAVIGRDGTLWFGQRHADGSRWHGMNLPANEYLGYVELPGRSEIRSGTREYVWLLEFDPNDVQYLTKRLVRQTP